MCENIKQLSIVRLHSSPSWGPLDMQPDHRYFYPNVRTYKEHAACTILDIALISTLYRCAICWEHHVSRYRKDRNDNDELSQRVEAT
ncbi:hypothetical protein CDAR_564821 [Caerostris darwini]|uniref:Uncharacterized protein n=1 Tax=Caerostris darwini TaxID=1538125 RepID=A0AAV4Q8J8_9ARAC|nr:hypothetical protein CDAR_564821 [Caerostris darwini]